MYFLLLLVGEEADWDLLSGDGELLWANFAGDLVGDLIGDLPGDLTGEVSRIAWFTIVF